MSDITVSSGTRTGHSLAASDNEAFSALIDSQMISTASATLARIAAAGTGTPSISTLNRTVEDMAIRDQNGNRLYGPEDFHSGYTMPTSSEAAEAVANRITSDPDVQFAIIGEVHTPTASERFFEIAQHVAKDDRPMVAVIETPTTNNLNKLIDQYQAGEISEEDFLDQGSAELHDHYMNAYNNHGAPLDVADDRPEPLTQDFWRDRLANDIVRYHQAGIQTELIDDGRFVPGANRDEVMADRMQEIAEDNPDAVIVAQLGLIHAQENSSMDLVPEFDINADTPDNSWSYRGAVMSKSDEQLPAAERLAQTSGGNAVLTFAMDELDEDDQGTFTYMWYGSNETVEKPTGESLSTNSVDYIIPSWDPEVVDNPNTNSGPTLQDTIPPAAS